MIDALDGIFLRLLQEKGHDGRITAIMRNILMRHGEVSMRELSDDVHYSQKHLSRLFLHHVGTSPKMFSRVVRVNYALKLMQNLPTTFTDVAAQAGYFDHPHFIHEFQTICGLTPKEYKQNMSIFYNDSFKM